MEQQYSAVLSELQAVRGQLDRIQDKGIKDTLLKGVSADSVEISRNLDIALLHSHIHPAVT